VKCFTNCAKYRTNDALPPCISPEEDLPVKPQKEWVHMDKLEPEKLEWIRDLPAPRRKGTKQVLTTVYTEHFVKRCEELVCLSHLVTITVPLR
jgi:hypothetical protein